MRRENLCVPPANARTDSADAMGMTARHTLGWVCLACLALASVAGLAGVVHLYGQGKIAALSRAPDLRFATRNNHVLQSAQSVALVIIGDSRAARWAPLPDGVGAVLLRGVGGETTVQTQARLAADAVALKPRFVLVLAGANDLVAASYMPAGQSAAIVEETAQRLKLMAEQIGAAGQCALIATIPPFARPSPLRRLVWRSQVVADLTALNGRLRSMASPTFAVLDLAASLPVDAENHLLASHAVDALHLNDVAYGIFNRVLRERMKEMRGEERCHWSTS